MEYLNFINLNAGRIAVGAVISGAVVALGAAILVGILGGGNDPGMRGAPLMMLLAGMLVYGLGAAAALTGFALNNGPASRSKGVTIGLWLLSALFILGVLLFPWILALPVTIGMAMAAGGDPTAAGAAGVIIFFFGIISVPAGLIIYVTAWWRTRKLTQEHDWS